MSRAEQALEEARERFHLASARAPEPWKPALAEVASLLFDAHLELVAVRRRHKLLKPKHSSTFREVFGEGLAAVVRRWRVETGARLLGDGALALGQVANLVGFASAATFRAALRNVQAATPTAFRPPKGPGPAPRTRGTGAIDQVARLRRFRCLAPDKAAAAEYRDQLSARLAHEKRRFVPPPALLVAKVNSLSTRCWPVVSFTWVGRSKRS